MSAQLRPALHEAVDELCGAKGASTEKWLRVMHDAEAMIASLDESREREVALERLMECTWWYTLAATGPRVMGQDGARKAVRRVGR